MKVPLLGPNHRMHVRCFEPRMQTQYAVLGVAPPLLHAERLGVMCACFPESVNCS